MLRAFLSPTAIAGHYGLQNPEPADNSWRECARQLSRGRRVYGEVERQVQVRANARLTLQNGIPTLPAFSTRVFPIIRSNCMCV